MHYYEIVKSWSSMIPEDRLLFDRDSIIEKIEKRMKSTLEKTAFDIRSKSILDDQKSIHQLLDDTSNWLPKDWPEGWEIYHELCQ